MPTQRELASGAAVGRAQAARCGARGGTGAAAHGGVAGGPVKGTAAAYGGLAGRSWL